jgi:hypothetical protein
MKNTDQSGAKSGDHTHTAPKVVRCMAETAGQRLTEGLSKPDDPFALTVLIVEAARTFRTPYTARADSPAVAPSRWHSTVPNGG